MKKKKLIIDYHYDFELIGIISSSKGYKLAWEINQLLSVRLKRKDDLVIHHKNKIKCTYSYFSGERSASQLKLFRNKPNESETSRNYLIAEHPHFDYILMTEGETNWSAQEFQDQLKKISSIEMVAFIPLDSLKEKDFFIF